MTPAFPQPLTTSNETIYSSSEVSPEFEGMSLRDYFAAKAMAAFMVVDRDIDNGQFTAEVAYRYADAMIAERKKK